MKRFYYTLFFLGFCVELFAQVPASLSETKTAAVQYAHSYLRSTELNRQDIVAVDSLVIQSKTIMREVMFANGLHVVMSGYKTCQPVLLYSFKNETLLFNIDELSNGLKVFLSNYIAAIDYASCGNIFLQIRPEWSNLLDTTNFYNTRSRVVYGPLLTTKWGQDKASKAMDNHAFNYYIESNEICIYGYCPTGCVATAMAQIMNYWKYPVYLSDKSYQFDWCNMADSLSSHYMSGIMTFVNTNYENERNAIARLMADCGKAAHMDYCYQDRYCQSFAWPYRARNALVDTFKYDPSAIRRLRSSYPNDSIWKSMIIDNLVNGWPVLYAGVSFETNDYESGGHAFVCDGYNEETDMFHFNWGHEYDDLDHNWNHLERAVFNIHPAYTQDYCNFSLPLCDHYYNYYTLLGNTTPDPCRNVPKTFTSLTSVPINPSYPSTWRTIPSGDTSEYVAHKEVVLQPGFTAEAGSTFVARIEPCADCEEGDGLRRQPSHKQNIKDETLLETFQGTSLQDGTTGGLLVYPNPTDGTVTVEATGDSPIRNVTVLDMSGRVLAGVTHTPHSENSYICTLDLRHLDSGLYLIRALTADGKTVSGKVVKN